MRVRTKGNFISEISKNSWFYVPHPRENPKLRLFCFPYAGGTAEVFHQWPENLADDIEVCAVQLPGRSTRRNEMPITRISIVVEELLRNMQPYLDQPFAFFGHSMGVLIAYELIQCLSKNNLKLPVHFFVSAHQALHIPSVNRSIHKMTVDECITLVRPYHIIPEAVLENQDLMKFILLLAKADFEMVETWSLNPFYPRLTIPIWAFGGADDNLAPPESIKAWRDYTENEFKAFIFQGEHFFILNADIRMEVLHLINQALAPWLHSEAMVVGKDSAG